MKITDALIAEHGVYYSMLDFIEETLPTLKSLPELQLLSVMLERSLRLHGETEEHYVLSAIDHALEEKGQRDRIHQVHLEIDVRLREVQSATDIRFARACFKGAIATTRKHFKYEEEIVFPMIERAMQPESLTRLGDAFVQQRHSQPKESAE